MITALIGENSFAIREAVQQLQADRSVTSERYNGDTLTRESIADIFGGMTLFAQERFVIIHDLSKNSELWSQLPELVPRIADTTTIIFIEEKVDKRTATYKALKQANVVQEFPVWTERDTATAQRWVQERAAREGVTLDRPLARRVVERVGLDQWQLASAIDTLALIDEVTAAAIDDHIEARPTENIFQLFETAMSGQATKTLTALQTLALTEDPYAVFALLSAQAAQLAVISEASPSDNVAKEFGLHPFVVTKLGRLAQQRGKRDVGRVLHLFAAADRQLKTSAADPWLIIRKTVLAL